MGTSLVPFLAARGHAVVRAVRGRDPGPGEARWDVLSGRIDPLDRFDAVVHLASENLAHWPWTSNSKRRFRDSRIGPTHALCETLAAHHTPTLIAASAVGIYGDRGDELLDESSSPGSGFLADLGQAWEGACDPLRRAGGRVVNLRTGLILGAGGGTLAALLLPFRLGLGGPLAGGRQYWSWVGVEDVVAVYTLALEQPEWSGAVNLVSPQPVRQREFARVLGRVLHRPAVLPAPAFALRLMMGEMADELVLASARVLPGRLSRAGFAFRHPDLAGALAAALGDGV